MYRRSTFTECEHLITIDLGENLEYINQWALYGVSTLEKLIIQNPNGVIRLGGSASGTVSGMSETMPNSTRYLYVPDDIVAEYKTTYELTRMKGLSELY